jgi:hypothetical protein
MYCNVFKSKDLAMTAFLPELEGRHVRLEPLQPEHAAGLAAAAAEDPSL